MRVTNISVELEKRVSDNDYGNAACDCPGAEMCDVCAGDWLAVPS